MKNDKQIQEMQILEQTMQNILIQKQAFEMELNETQSALEELEKAGEEVYRIIGQLMLKTNKSRMTEELKEKEKIIELRLKTLEKQEGDISEKLESIREEFLSNQK